MMNDIEKLLCCRNAMDIYRNDLAIKGVKSPSDTQKLQLSFQLAEISQDNFTEFNRQMNFQEIDRCYRFRRIDNPEVPYLCDLCAGRSAVVCQNSVCGNGDTYFTLFRKYVPNSLMVQEQEGADSGDVIRFHAEPVWVYLTKNYNGTWPGFCEGRFIKILEPDFDVFWGMEMEISFGDVIYNILLNTNKDG